MKSDNGSNGNGEPQWVRRILERIEDHIHAMREYTRKNDERWKQNDERWKQNDERWQKNDERWEKNEKRWQAQHRLLEHMLSEIQKIKTRR